MLATLNLQLSPVDLLDDTLTNSTTLLPDAGGEAESGFAHLLRLRVDTTLQPELASGQLRLQEGEMLPRGGNPLPPAQVLPALIGSESQLPNTTLEIEGGEQQRLPIESPVPSAPIASQEVERLLPRAQPTTAAEHAGTTELSGEITDIALSAPVFYPPQRDVPAAVPAMATGSADVPLPAGTAVQVQPPTIEASADVLDDRAGLRTRPAVPQLTHPELAARTQDVFASAREPVELPAASVGLRERGQRLMPDTKPLPASPVALPIDALEETTRAELPKRLDLVTPQRTDSVRDTVTEIVQPRPVTPQPVQTLQVQPAAHSSQPSQPIIAAAPAPAITADASYATTVQHSTDLIGTPVRDASWGEQISERVVLMAGKNFNSAEIRLTPAELGPLRVRVSIEDGAANVTFHVNHAVTREAIEQAMPRLREMLAENGLTLGDADVGEQGAAERDSNGQADGRLSQEAADETLESATADELGLAPDSRKQNGLVDTFA